MSITFAPCHHSDANSICDFRVSLIAKHNTKNPRARRLGLDVRLSPYAAKEIGLRHGDRVIVTREDDGSWWVYVVMPNESGYSVRMGKGKKPNGKKGCAYFRLSCTDQDGAVLFPDGERSLSCDLVGVEGRRACFSPVSKRSGLRFAPAS